ncbi:MAG: relaxase/mobilization nuclease domain-containing protein, partial [Candidatus Brocadiales bacterium]|nr:relaxase/mobilization nuclease domain-containing protein [Candidatus Brocadiales bacterium]
MAVVNVRWIHDAAKDEDYYLSREDKYVSGIYLMDDKSATEQFVMNQKLHNNVGVNQSISLLQSWNEEESKKLSIEQINNMGRELTERYFPGHKALVVTHYNTKCIHNHIMVDPVNAQTGKRVKNKKEHLHKLRDLNDNIAKENGLSVIEKVNSKSKEPQKARKAEHYSSSSRIHDLKNKIDFSKKYARNFQEHSQIMGEFNIEVRKTNKTISYKYPGMERRKRGDKLGEDYTVSFLKKRFEDNQKRLGNGAKVMQLMKKDEEYSKLRAITIQREKQDIKNKDYQKLKGRLIKDGIVSKDRFKTLQKSGRVSIYKGAINIYSEDRMKYQKFKEKGGVIYETSHLTKAGFKNERKKAAKLELVLLPLSGKDSKGGGVPHLRAYIKG